MNGRINVSGTPVPSREREAQVQAAGPVRTYRLTPEEMERYRAMGGGNGKRPPIITQSQEETAIRRRAEKRSQTNEEQRERKREERRERIMQPARKAQERSRDAEGIEWYAPRTIGSRATSRMELRVKRTSLTITAGAAALIAPGEEHVALTVGMRGGEIIIRRVGAGEAGVGWHRNNRSVVDGSPIGGLYCTTPALLRWLLQHGLRQGSVVPLTWDAERQMLVGRVREGARSA
ncbi:MAG: hypothetical protein IMW98_08490 [Firmicutes bacterium]|nr:hypothetical protein [Bacillota bacterium]MBE3590843.1 hypothetical protein [Bacillota bacterium]